MEIGVAGQGAELQGTAAGPAVDPNGLNGATPARLDLGSRRLKKHYPQRDNRRIIQPDAESVGSRPRRLEEEAFMRKLYWALASVAIVGMAPAANAAHVVVTSATVDAFNVSEGAFETTIGFEDAGLTSPNFTESLAFTNTMAGVYNFTLQTSSANVDFTSAILAGPGGPYNLVEQFDDTVEFWTAANLNLIAGAYTLTINGANRGTGVLSGTVAIAAIPEPATWGMMLLGFAAVGYQMRKRRRPALMQLA